MTNHVFFLGRQPILDREGRIVAYELLFRTADSLVAEIDDAALASSDVMFNTLSTFGVKELLGGRQGFINVSAETLMTDFIELLPSDQIVVELMESVGVDDEVLERCSELKERGFRLALDNHVYGAAWEPLYGIVDIVKIDVLATPDHDLAEASRKLRQWPLTLLAEKIETTEQHDHCLRLGFDLFQGFHFARPVTIAGKQISMSNMVLVKLFRQLTDAADIREIEEIIKLDPGLTYNLLRLVNSVALGAKEKISSLGHAVMMVGTDQIRVWVLLAIMIAKRSAGGFNPLLELAVMRGRLLELLVARLPYPAGRGSKDRAFLTGALSILHLVLELPLADLVEQLSLNEEMGDALVRKRGLLGELLLLVETAEQGECREIVRAGARLGLSVDHLSAAQIEAIKWSNAMLVAE